MNTPTYEETLAAFMDVLSCLNAESLKNHTTLSFERCKEIDNIYLRLNNMKKMQDAFTHVQGFINDNDIKGLKTYLNEYKGAFAVKTIDYYEKNSLTEDVITLKKMIEHF